MKRPVDIVRNIIAMQATTSTELYNVVENLIGIAERLQQKDPEIATEILMQAEDVLEQANTIKGVPNQTRQEA